MNNSPMNLNSIRQPAPSIQSTPIIKKERTYNAPNVGVVDVPKISKTPFSDFLAQKKIENPRMAYLLTSKPQTGFKLQNVFSLAIAGCSIGALLNLLKKK